MYYFSMAVAVLGSNTSQFDLIYTGAERKIDGCVRIGQTDVNTDKHTDAQVHTETFWQFIVLIGSLERSWSCSKLLDR
jgi:hypothetical protein